MRLPKTVDEMRTLRGAELVRVAHLYATGRAGSQTARGQALYEALLNALTLERARGDDLASDLAAAVRGRDKALREVQRVLDSPCESCRDMNDARNDAIRWATEAQEERDKAIRERDEALAELERLRQR